MAYRLGVDVGGTFTDLLLLNDESGEAWRDKVPSTPHDPSVAVVDGTRAICQKAGVNASDVALFMHGTTVATNTVLTSTGARVGLVTTRRLSSGAADRPFLRARRLGRLDHLEQAADRSRRWNARSRCAERMGVDGEIVAPLDEADLRAKLETLKAQNIEALTISFINSYIERCA